MCQSTLLRSRTIQDKPRCLKDRQWAAGHPSVKTLYSPRSSMTPSFSTCAVVRWM
eukprot:m.227154 g.227154  ORF g.227154 m.227154 type:complete len:55 (+) comp17319_c0_seq2:4360-4524(+)